MVRIPSDREPTHPGDVLLNEFPQCHLEMTQHDLAQAIHVPYQRVNEVVRGPPWRNAEHGAQACQVLRNVLRASG